MIRFICKPQRRLQLYCAPPRPNHAPAPKCENVNDGLVDDSHDTLRTLCAIKELHSIVRLMTHTPLCTRFAFEVLHDSPTKRASLYGIYV